MTPTAFVFLGGKERFERERPSEKVGVRERESLRADRESQSTTC